MTLANGPKRGANAYNQVAVQTGVSGASPHRLIQMLIDAALEKIAMAKGFIVNGKIANKGQQIGLAVSIIDGLRASLDKERGGEISTNLDALYDYMIRRLTTANMNNDVAILDEVTSLLLPIKEAWDAIPEDIRQAHEQQQSVTDSNQEAVTG